MCTLNWVNIWLCVTLPFCILVLNWLSKPTQFGSSILIYTYVMSLLSNPFFFTFCVKEIHCNELMNDSQNTWLCVFILVSLNEAKNGCKIFMIIQTTLKQWLKVIEKLFQAKIWTSWLTISGAYTLQNHFTSMQLSRIYSNWCPLFEGWSIGHHHLSHNTQQ